MLSNKKINPQLKWAQRKDRIYITFNLIEIKNPLIDLVDNKILKFSGEDKENSYDLQLELYEEISKEESKYVFATRNIFLNLKKKETGPYWPRLQKSSGKFNFINIDWNLYVDEDEEKESNLQPNFTNMGEEQGFPGFNDDEIQDEDDIPN